VTVRRARTAALGAGLGAALAAVSPPVDALADGSLTGHMAQHLLLTMVAPPLIVVGSPVALLLRRLPRPAARRLVRAADTRPVHVLAQPAVGWAALVGVQLAIHLTGVFELALRDAPVHAAEHLALLGAALLFWRPLLGADPLPRLAPAAALAYLLAAMPANDVVGIWLMSSSGVEYPAYAGAGLADQHRAGVVMLAGSFVLAAAALRAAWAWVELDHRRTLLREGVR
jgi:putative membrane protein